MRFCKKDYSWEIRSWTEKLWEKLNFGLKDAFKKSSFALVFPVRIVCSLEKHKTEKKVPKFFEFEQKLRLET